jgi:four helix bundle suffix protein
MDYLASRHLQRWEPGHKRYDGMLKFCRTHNKVEDYQDYFEKWTDEEMANTALTLCHMVDKMMTTYQRQQEELFVKEGGIKERMTAARLGYRTNQREEIERLTRELAAANRQIADLETKLAKKDRKN